MGGRLRDELLDEDDEGDDTGGEADGAEDDVERGEVHAEVFGYQESDQTRKMRRTDWGLQGCGYCRYLAVPAAGSTTVVEPLCPQ